MASNAFGNAKRPAGKKFRDGLVGEALDDLYSDIDGAFEVAEAAAVAKPTFPTELGPVNDNPGDPDANATAINTIITALTNAGILTPPVP